MCKRSDEGRKLDKGEKDDEWSLQYHQVTERGCNAYGGKVTQKLQVLDPISKVTDLAIELGRQEALKTFQLRLLPDIALENMHGYDDT